MQVSQQTAEFLLVLIAMSYNFHLTLPSQDFRSKAGLYNLINADYNARLSSSPSTPALRIASGKDLFDCSLWKDELSTSVFRTFVASLRRKIREDVRGATATHRFIRHLRDQKKLVRCYTQNIDGLESRDGLCTNLQRGRGSRTRFSKKAIGLPGSSISALPGSALPGSAMDRGCEVVQLHGDLETLRCTICAKASNWDSSNNEATFLAGEAPECQYCSKQDQDRRDLGKRGITVGVLRPNIVLYGEEHPSSDVIASISAQDLKLRPDTVIILGTSLHVYGLKALVKDFAKVVHGKKGSKGSVIYVNLTKPAESVWNNVIDYWVAMDCDEWVRCARARRPDLWQTQKQLSPLVVKSADLMYSVQEKTLDVNEGDKENPVVVQTPKSVTGKARHKPRAALYEHNAMAQGTAKKHDAPKNNNIRTPSKSRQLLTPPSSRHHNPKGSDSPEKSADLEDKDAILVTPSKHRKVGVKIWEDAEDEGVSIQDEAQPWLTTREHMSSTATIQVLTHSRAQANKHTGSQMSIENGAITTASRRGDPTYLDNNVLPDGSSSGGRTHFHVQVPSRNVVGKPQLKSGLKRKRAERMR